MLMPLKQPVVNKIPVPELNLPNIEPLQNIDITKPVKTSIVEVETIAAKDATENVPILKEPPTEV